MSKQYQGLVEKLEANHKQESKRKREYWCVLVVAGIPLVAKQTDVLMENRVARNLSKEQAQAYAKLFK